MGIKIAYREIVTDKPLDEVRNISMQVFSRLLGGNIYPTQTGFVVQEGKNGISLAGFAALTTTVYLRKTENGYDLQCFMNWGAGTWTIVMIVLTFLTGISLLFAALYFLFDPMPAYQNALYQLDYYFSQHKEAT